METLIKRAVELPGEIERMIAAEAAKKDHIFDLIQRKREIEDETAGIVASDRQRYPNEESRRAEIMRRLRENETYQNLEEQIKAERRELAHLEARAERAKGEMGATNALLNLLAASIHAKRGDVELLMRSVINPVTSPAMVQATQASVAENPASAAGVQRESGRNRPSNSGGEAQNGESLPEIVVKVIEASVNDRGTTRAWCEIAGESRKVAIFAKNGNGQKLRAAAGAGKTLKVKYRELDAGWFAVAVTAA